MSTETWPYLADKGELNKLIVKDLKLIATKLNIGIKSSSKKDLYVKAISEALIPYHNKPIDENDKEFVNNMLNAYKNEKRVTFRGKLLYGIIHDYLLKNNKVVVDSPFKKLNHNLIGKFIYWLHENASTTIFDTESFMKTADINSYGSFGKMRYIRYFNFTSKQVKSIANNDNNYNNKDVMDLVKLPDNWVKLLKDYMVSLFKPNNLELPKIKGYKVVVKYYNGTSNDPGGFPAIELVGSNHVIKTPLYGYGFFKLDHCIVELTGARKELFEVYTKYKPARSDFRNLALYLSILPKNVLNELIYTKYTDGKSPQYGRSKTDIYSRCINIPIITKYLDDDGNYNPIYTNDEFSPRNFFINLDKFVDKYKVDHANDTIVLPSRIMYDKYEWIRWQLIDKLMKGTLHKSRMKTNYLKGTPFYIEDYITNSKEAIEDIIRDQKQIYDGLSIVNNNVFDIIYNEEAGYVYDYILNNAQELGLPRDLQDDLEYDALTILLDVYDGPDSGKTKLISLAKDELFNINEKLIEYDLLTYISILYGYFTNYTDDINMSKNIFLTNGIVKNKEFAVYKDIHIPDYITSENLTPLLNNLYNDSLVNILSREQIIRVLTIGYFDTTKIDKNILYKDSLWKSFNSTQKRLLGITRDDIELEEANIYRKFINRNDNPGYVNIVTKHFKDDTKDNILKVAKSLNLLVPNEVEPIDYIVGAIPYMWSKFNPTGKPIEQFNKYDGGTYEQYSDIQLYTMAQAFTGHTSRKELIENVESILISDTVPLTENQGKMFFYPFPGTCNSFNDLYIRDFGDMDDPEDSPKAKGALPICYGYREDGKNIALNLDQLKSGFAEEYVSNSPDGSPSTIPVSPTNERYGGRSFKIYDLKRGDNVFAPLKLSEVNQLRVLCVYMKDSYKGVSDEYIQGFKELIKEIDICKIYVKNVDKDDLLAISIFNNMDSKSKMGIGKCFYLLFRVGMFFRRWDGVGDYPLVEKDTKNTGVTFDSDANTAKARYEFNKVYDNLDKKAKSFMDNIKLIHNKHGKLTKRDRLFGNYWASIVGKTGDKTQKDLDIRASYFTAISNSKDQTKTSEERKEFANEALVILGDGLPEVNIGGSICIRMASSVLVGTGYYYGKFFGSFNNNELRGFNPLDVVDIQ